MFSHALQAVRNATLFFEGRGEASRADSLRRLTAGSFRLVAQSGPLLYHSTANDAEFAEILSILGAARKFKISQLRLSVPVHAAPGRSVEELARDKVQVRQSVCSFFFFFFFFSSLPLLLHLAFEC